MIVHLNLEKSVGSRILAQVVDSTALQKNTRLTEWVKLIFFKNTFKPMTCTIIPRPTDLSRFKLQAGVTLIELVISMVIISIAMVGVLSVMNLTVSHSADPLIQNQAVAIAESYLEEILLQSYLDDGESGETRATFDSVDDYNSLSDTGVHDQQGNLITTLANYNVLVSVSPVSLTGGISAKKVTVEVSGGGKTINLAGYRVNI